MGVAIATLIVVVLALVVSVYFHLWTVATLERAISRQDDRIRRRLERQVETNDQDELEQIAHGIRGGGVLEESSLRDRYPDARLPEEL